MIKKYLFVIIVVFFNFYTTLGQTSVISKVSSKITEKQLRKKIIEKKNDISFYENIRNKVIAKDSLNFIGSCDTIFFLETYAIETGISYGRIWSSRKAISYEYFKDELTFREISFFDVETLKLVQTWDINSIRNYESKYSTMISPLTIYATRVILNRGKIDVECLKFDEIFIR